MVNRALVTVATASLLAWPGGFAGAHAENKMGYRLLSQQEAAALPRNHGGIGLDIERAQQITDDGMTFDIIRVKQVRPGQPGAQAGLKVGDDIIAVDGRVFASLVAFAGYVGSVTPGTPISVDYIPAGGGPQQAQRVAVSVGVAGQAAPASPPASSGMSTGTKVAIGLGAVALLGCYEMGCFSHRTNTGKPASGQPAARQPAARQPSGAQQP